MSVRLKPSALIVLSIAAVLVLGGVYYVITDSSAPELKLSHSGQSVSPKLPITLTASDPSGIKSIAVMARYSGNEVSVVRKDFSDKAPQQQLSFTLEGAGLKHNDAIELSVTAVDASLGGFGFGNKKTLTLPLKVDAVPPKANIKSPPPHIRTGGSTCIVYSLSKSIQQTGVTVGDRFFPSFRQQNGDYICFFAFPYNMPVEKFTPKLAALDEAGNMLTLEVPLTKIKRQFKSDTISIGEGFLNAKKDEFAIMAPGDMSEIERFLVVNGSIRKANADTLIEIGKRTSPDVLWRGVFLRLPRSATRSGFADHRTYMNSGKKIDEQTHLGLDLASIKHDTIPAANSGTVVFADYLGIYGNLVIVDHGLGLQSLYSHMSELGVIEGQVVAKGDALGKTGVTGMAGGDHLHFGMLVGGLEVSPDEWLDSHWITDNIADRLKKAGVNLD